MPKSGHYFLDTSYSDTVPDFCKDSCVYVKERLPGDDPVPEGSRFCFKPSSTYTAECQDTGDGSIAIDSSSVIDGGIAIDSSSVIDGGIAIDSSSVADSTDSKPSDSPGIEMDSPEMKPDSESIFYQGEFGAECKFGPLGLLSATETSYTVEVDVSNFTSKEGGVYFAFALDLEDGTNIIDSEFTAEELKVRLLENDVVFDCTTGFVPIGPGSYGPEDIGCYANEDKPIPPMVYNLEVNFESAEAVPIIKGLIFGGDDVCQDHHDSTGDSMGSHEDSEPIFYQGEFGAECKFGPLGLLSATETSYTVE